MYKTDNNSTLQTNNKDNKKKLNMNKGYFEYFKIIFILALIVGAIYLIFRFLKKALKIKDDVGEGAVIISSQTLGPGKWLQVIFIGGKYLIIGVTNDNINLISEITDLKEIERLEIAMNDKKTEEGDGFVDILSGFFKGNLKTKPPKKSFDYETDSVDFLKKQKERIDKLGE